MIHEPNQFWGKRTQQRGEAQTLTVLRRTHRQNGLHQIDVGFQLGHDFAAHILLGEVEDFNRVGLLDCSCDIVRASVANFVLAQV